MHAAIIILEPPGWELGELRRQLRAATPTAWTIQLVSTEAELLAALDGDDCQSIVIVPQGSGAGECPPHDGLSSIARIRASNSTALVVVVAREGSVATAASAVAAGATDFLVLAGQLRERVDTLLGKLRGVLEVIERNRQRAEHSAWEHLAEQARQQIVGQSPAVRTLREQIARVATVPRPVLIVGERGTGKELVARAIHFAAGPRERPIVTVNCAAFSDALLESELFGHEKGAFTGANAARRGKFALADRGTLFLDEISHMSTAFQEKILRVVEYGTFTPVGSGREEQTDVRIIAATNRQLRELIEAGEFLVDLHDRLAFETIEVPPLRERRGDIALLARYFLDAFARETPAFGGKRLSTSAIAALNRYPFPGNVRELKNIIERAAYRDTGGEITPEDLGLPENHRGGQDKGGSFHQQLDALGRRMIDTALKRAAGNQAQAARDLGLSYHQFRYYLKKYQSSGDLR